MSPPEPHLVPREQVGRWRRFAAALPMRTSLVAVGVVWLLGCAWSFQEQTAFATSKGFAFPHLLPLVIDGFAVSMAGVSWAASLDARPALPARLATLVAVGASSGSNGGWAYLRTHHDVVAVALGMAVPIAANMAFEVLLAELRRQVQRRRGLPAPVAVPYPRLIRLVLAPAQTFRSWRITVLILTQAEQPGPERLTSQAELERPAALAPTSVTPSSGAAELDPSGSREPTLTASVLPISSQDPPPSRVRSIGLTSQLASGSVPGRSDEPETRLQRGGERSPTVTPARGSRAARAAELARYLSTHGDFGEITGEHVGHILGIAIAPRTGRRLLLMARELLVEAATAGGDQTSPPRVAVGR